MLTGWKLTLSKCFLIPQRYVVGIMGFLAILNAYTMRITLSIAITEMVAPVNSTGYSSTDETCPDPIVSGGGSILEDPEELFDWTEEQQGLILSSFYWGYILTHMPGGILAEKFGGKHSLGLGILSTAVFTLLTPAVARTGNWLYLCILRMLVGLGEGTTFPALNAILAKWVPMSERSRIGSLTFAGSLLGTVIGNAASGIVIEVTQDWASVFYLFGGFGLVWFVIWNFLCYSDPESHPFISDAEKTYLGKELSSVTNEKKSIPWKAMLTSVPLWALIAAQIGHDWGFYIMVTDLPKYMKDVLKFKISENGLWSAVPYVLMWVVSISSGWLCDWIIMKGYMSITFARKFFTTVASVCPAVFIIAASYSGCDRIATVIFFSIAMGFMGTFYCGMKVNALDLAPNFAGTAMAIVNGIGAITGIISPALIGLLTPDHALSQWRTVFWITLVILVVTNVIYIFFGSGKEQWWNEIGAAKPSKTTKYQATAGESVVKVYP